MKGNWTIAVLVAVAAVGVYSVRAGRISSLEAEVVALEVEPVGAPVGAPGGEVVVGGGEGEVEEVDREAVYAGVVGPVQARFEEVGREKVAEVMWAADLAVENLDAEELVALLGYDPELKCSKAIFADETGDDEIVKEAILVMALKRLFDVAPELAVPLAVGSGAASEEIGDVGLHNTVWRGLGEWAKKDFSAATAFMDANEGKMYMGEIKRYLMLQAYAEADMKGALEYAEERGELRQAMSYIGRSVRAETLGDFFAVAEGLPEVGWYRSQFYADFAVKVNNTHGWDAARAFVEEYGTGLEWVGGLAAGVAVADVRNRPTEKVEWIVEMSGDTGAGGNVGRFVEKWTEADFGGVAAWLGTVRDEPWRDAAVAAFVKKVAVVDPAGAAEWAGTIEDGEERERLVKALGE